MTTYAAKIIADSIYPDGPRLSTMEVTFPRKVLAELNTHRKFSRNSASSRAIPVEKMLRRVLETPYVPTRWGLNQAGMQAHRDAEAEVAEGAVAAWLCARDAAVQWAQTLLTGNIHKQITNRLVEPFMWHTALISSTDWDNFFNLRDSDEADPDIAIPARLMREAYEAGTPQILKPGEWHLPLTTEEERLNVPIDQLIKISVGRCARVSYLTHDGKRDLEADIKLYDRLVSAGHMSPLEHVARPATEYDSGICLAQPSDVIVGYEFGHGRSEFVAPAKQHHGNFIGWVSQRKLVPGEEDILGYRKQNA